MPVPSLNIINESIRNLYFHVPMWFTMILLFTGSFIYSIKYLRGGNLRDDIYASQLTNTGIFFSILGMLSGMEWATYTWGGTLTDDPKQMCTAIAILIYMAYLVLRMSIHDLDKRARISAVFNIFAFALLIPLTYIIPRMVDSLHPGSATTPGFASKDTDGSMKLVLYPAFIGWTLLSVWIFTLVVRYRKLQLKNIFK